MVVCSFNLFRRPFYVYDIENQDLSLVRLYLFHLSVKSHILSCWRRYKVRPCDVTVTFFTCSSLVYVYLLAPAISPHVPQLFPLSSHVHVQRESQGLQINRQSSKNPICPPPTPLQTVTRTLSRTTELCCFMSASSLVSTRPEVIKSRLNYLFWFTLFLSAHTQREL